MSFSPRSPPSPPRRSPFRPNVRSSTLSVSSSITVLPPVTSSDSIKVSVRARPFNTRERSADPTSPLCCLKMDTVGGTVRLLSSSSTALSSIHDVRGSVRSSLASSHPSNGAVFQFDHVFWSVETPDACGATPATQADVFRTIGYPLVQHAFDGFNSCLFAYGQTGSGKTYTMMGADVSALGGEGSGVTPRICLEIFARKASVEAQGHSRWIVELGYVEVYNERVSDLLGKRKKGVKGGSEEVHVDVREHPSRGVFLEGQRLVEVGSLDDVVRLIEVGNGVRHTAATKMNDRSSRSHAIIMLLLREERTMTTKSGETIRTAGKSSRMNLVDLAGSERVTQSQVEGQQFKEATHINLSLTTLGRVIDVLADMATKGAKAQYSVAPFRDSKLTFILKDSLGGNSKTFMIATVSPSALNYEETLSTLRYASRARDIVNVAQVNEDPRARRIRELEEQMEDMRQAMAGGDPAYVSELEEKLALLESEAQKRAADLQALEREREKNEIRDLMLKATEAERLELLERADALEQEVADSRAQAERMELENKRMLALQREKEALLRAREASLEKHCQEMRRRECSMAHHRDEWQVTIEEERWQQKTVLVQLMEADARNFHMGSFLEAYVSEVRQCWCATLNSALLQCRQGADASKARVDRLTAISCELQSQLADLKNELREAHKALAEAQAKAAQLSTDATAAATQYTTQLTDANKQLHQLRQDLEDAARENNTLRTQLDETTKNLDTEHAAMTESKQSADELRRQVDSAAAAAAQLQAENRASDAALKVATDENAMLTGRLTQLLDEQKLLCESLQRQQEAAAELARFDERWSFPDLHDATTTSTHMKEFPHQEWSIVVQNKSQELHRVFRDEAALACRVRPRHITNLHFELGSLRATFTVQHSQTISAKDIEHRLNNYQFRAMQELYDQRHKPPDGLDALALENARLQTDRDKDRRDIIEAHAEKERLQSELEEKGSEAEAAKADNEALRGELEEAHAEKERVFQALSREAGDRMTAVECWRGLEKKVNAVVADRDSLSLIVAETVKEKAALAKRCADAEGKTALLSEETEDLRGKLRVCEDKLRAAAVERRELSDELTSAVRAKRKLEKDKERLKEGYVQSEKERRKLGVRFEARNENHGSEMAAVPCAAGKQPAEGCFRATRTALKVLQSNGVDVEEMGA